MLRPRLRCILLLPLILLIISSCREKITSADLHGRWKYITVENRNKQDSLPEGEIERQAPAIIFSKSGKLTIEWGGKTLSTGKYQMENEMIRYTEDLPGNQTREFPFLITKLNSEELVFQTMDQNTTTVSARKVTGADQ